MGIDGLLVSGCGPDASLTLPTDIGNRHFQHTSDIGFTHRPSPALLAAADAEERDTPQHDTVSHRAVRHDLNVTAPPAARHKAVRLPSHGWSQ